MQNNKKKDKKKKLGRKTPQGNKIWRYLIWFLLLYLVFSYFFGIYSKKDRIEISYTEFKKQVEKGNVEKILVKGEEITGKFTNNYKVQKESGEEVKTYQLFSTTKPSIDDKELMQLLENNDVTIDAEKQDRSWLPYFLILGLPWLLIIGYFIYVRRKMSGKGRGMMGGGVFGIGKSRAKRYHKTSAGVTFDDVAGLKNAKKDLLEIVEYLKNPEKFTSLGADIPKGILLMGPPGSGKTLLSRATAGEADVSFFSISGSEFIEMFVGVGASRVRDMFENAKKDAPSIVFIDEIDSVGRARGTGIGGGHDEREQTLNQILSEMDGFEPHESVVVMAATNRPDVLDPALIRPGRFDRQITLDLPQKESRKKILEIHTRKVPLDKDVDLDNLAARTVSFSGADLKNLVNEAALLAGRKDQKKVKAEDFEEARDKILLGAEREEKIDEEEKKHIAYHEAGHALVAKLIPKADPLQKVTIIPRGGTLGATEQVPEKDKYNMGEEYLLNRIAVTLGGRVAEKIIFNELSNGAANDLKQVTRIARLMVCQWGMSEKLGPVWFQKGEEHLFLGKELAQTKDFSEYTAKLIDDEIRNIVTKQEDRVLKLLNTNKEKLNALAEALLEQETLENNDIEKILENTKNKESKSKKKGTKKKAKSKSKSQ